MTIPTNDNLIRFPDDRERNPNDYGQRCPRCGSAIFFITLADRIRCYECEDFFEFDEG